MPYASKRKANIEKILKQEVGKCKKLSDFFSKSENATTLCDTNRVNVAKLSAPIEVPMQRIGSEVQDLDTITANKENEPREIPKESEQDNQDLDAQNRVIEGFEGNAQFVHTQAHLNNTNITTLPGLPRATQASTQLTTVATTEYYRGYPLDLKALTRRCGNDVLSTFYEKSRVSTESRVKARVFVKCCVCAEFEDEAKRFSANGRVYIAQGVRCDGKKKLQDVIDHLLGPSHRAA